MIDIQVKEAGDRVYEYKEFIEIKNGSFEMKENQDFPVEIDWFQVHQIQTLFEKDKRNNGFREKKSRLEEILLEPNKKKVYPNCINDYYHGIQKMNQ